MAPAALDTIITHLKDTGRKPSYYDAIITGDLGHIGKEIVIELAEKQGYNIKSKDRLQTPGQQPMPICVEVFLKP